MNLDATLAQVRSLIPSLPSTDKDYALDINVAKEHAERCDMVIAELEKLLSHAKLVQKGYAARTSSSRTGIEDIPHEILGSIFELVVEMQPDGLWKTSSQHWVATPLLLATVSRTFNIVAVGNSAIWTRIDLDNGPSPEGCRRLLKLFLERSKGQDLQVLLKPRLPANRMVRETLIADFLRLLGIALTQSHRWQELVVQSPHDLLKHILPLPTLPRLSSATFHVMRSDDTVNRLFLNVPILSCFRLDNATQSHGNTGPEFVPWHQITSFEFTGHEHTRPSADILSRMPHLKQYFVQTSWRQGTLRQPSTPWNHQQVLLKDLHTCQILSLSRNSMPHLQDIIAPKLHELSLPQWESGYKSLFHGLICRSQVLQKLSLILEPHQFASALQNLPSTSDIQRLDLRVRLRNMGDVKRYWASDQLQPLLESHLRNSFPRLTSLSLELGEDEYGDGPTPRWIVRKVGQLLADLAESLDEVRLHVHRCSFDASTWLSNFPLSTHPKFRITYRSCPDPRDGKRVEFAEYATVISVSPSV